MRIKCIKDKNSKLIKDHIYETYMLTQNANGQFNSIYVAGVGRYTIDRFTTVSGKPLSEVGPFNEQAPNRWGTVADESDKDTYIAYRSGRSKKLVRGNFYKMVGWKSIEKQYSGGRKYYDNYIKIAENSRWLKANNFRKLSTAERRDLNISIAFQEENNKTKEYDRAYDAFDKEEKALTIFKKILNANRLIRENGYEISTIDFCLRNDRMGLTKEDFEEVGEFKFKDLFIDG